MVKKGWKILPPRLHPGVGTFGDKSWTEFRLKLEDRFHVFPSTSAYQCLLNIKEDSLVSSYRAEFGRLSAPFPGLPQNQGGKYTQEPRAGNSCTDSHDEPDRISGDYGTPPWKQKFLFRHFGKQCNLWQLQLGHKWHCHHLFQLHWKDLLELMHYLLMIETRRRVLSWFYFRGMLFTPIYLSVLSWIHAEQQNKVEG